MLHLIEICISVFICAKTANLFTGDKDFVQLDYLGASIAGAITLAIVTSLFGISSYRAVMMLHIGGGLIGCAAYHMYKFDV